MNWLEQLEVGKREFDRQCQQDRASQQKAKQDRERQEHLKQQEEERAREQIERHMDKSGLSKALDRLFKAGGDISTTGGGFVYKHGEGEPAEGTIYMGFIKHGGEHHEVAPKPIDRQTLLVGENINFDFSIETLLDGTIVFRGLQTNEVPLAAWEKDKMVVIEKLKEVYENPRRNATPVTRKVEKVLYRDGRYHYEAVTRSGHFVIKTEPLER